MKARVLLLTAMLGWINSSEAGAEVIELASPDSGAVFSGRAVELKLVVYGATPEEREIKASWLQLARQYGAPVALPDAGSLLLPPSPEAKRMLTWKVTLPAVKRKTEYSVTLAATGTLRLTAYPETLLQPLRDATEAGLKVHVLSSATKVRAFLAAEKIQAGEMESFPPGFVEPGIFLAEKRRGEETPASWPRELAAGQAWVVFVPPATVRAELPRVIVRPLGRGTLVEVHLPGLLEQLTSSPRAQETFAEIIELARGQNQPTNHTQLP